MIKNIMIIWHVTLFLIIPFASGYTPETFSLDQAGSEEVTKTLQENGIIVFETDDSFTYIANQLFEEFSLFLSQPIEVKEIFSSKEPSDITGYTNQVRFGALSGEKFFILDSLAKLNKQEFPSRSEGNNLLINPYLKLSDIFSELTHKLQKNLFMQLEISKGNQHQIERAFSDYDILGKLHQYHSIDLSELEERKSNGNLIVSEEGLLVSFPEHKDAGLYTFLIYKNDNAEGLQIEHDGKFCDVVLPALNDRLGIIVMTGSLLEAVTQQKQPALRHRVVSYRKDFFDRMLLSYFVQWQGAVSVECNNITYNAGEFLGNFYNQHNESLQKNAEHSKEIEANAIYQTLK